jgi:hypothetical protein
MFETAYAKLLTNLVEGDADAVQQAIFELGGVHNETDQIPDSVVERLVTLLRNERMYNSDLAGHVLNYFEFESPRLTDWQKRLVIGFLKAHGDQFSHVHSQQVVAELREGKYLQLSEKNSLK